MEAKGRRKNDKEKTGHQAVGFKKRRGQGSLQNSFFSGLGMVSVTVRFTALNDTVTVAVCYRDHLLTVYRYHL